MRQGCLAVSAGGRVPNGKRAGTVVFAVILGLALLPSLSRTSLGFVHGLPLWLALLAVVNRRRTLAILAFPLLLCLPAVLYYQHVYRMAPGVSLWLILLNCSQSEIIEYLAGFALPLGIWVALVVSMFALTFRYLHGPIFEKRTFRWLCLVTLLIPVSIPIRYHHGDEPMVEVAGQYFRDSFPWSAVIGRQQARDVLAAFDNAEREVAESGKVTVERLANAAEPRTIVLVIGESARRDRHSIYGYAQPTTPAVEQVSGLLAFSDVVTLYPYTTDAVPVILAKRDRLVRVTHPSPNLVSAFAAAGFRTSWISNQAALGPDDSPVSIYAKYADERAFARTLSRFGSIPYDEEILPKVRAELVATELDKFVVVHLFGSHEEFERRYPAEYAVSKDAYDNSVRYTDAVLARILADLEKMPGQNALIYVADHGLKLGECDGRSEHFDVKEAYDVPLYIWTSPAWQKAHRRLWENANANRALPATTLSVFDTLMDLADLRYPQYESGLSLLSKRPNVQRRMVHTFTDLVDYDQGFNDERCHLVRAER